MKLNSFGIMISKWLETTTVLLEGKMLGSLKNSKYVLTKLKLLGKKEFHLICKIFKLFIIYRLAQELAAVYSGEDESAVPLSPHNEMSDFRRRLSSLYHFSPDTARRISIGPRRLSQATWSPSPNTLEDPRRFSLRDLEKLYASLGGAEPPRLSLGGAFKVG